MIKKVKYNNLIKIVLILLTILLLLEIIRKCKIIGFCCTLINLISPLFFGYALAWLIKPIMLKFNKKLSDRLSAILTFSFLIAILTLFSYFLIPIIIKEIKNIIPEVVNFYQNIPVRYTKDINMPALGKKVLTILSNCTSNIKNIILNSIYSIFISYYFLVSHKRVSQFISKYLPASLITEISLNLKTFVKGTIIDTGILFILSLISFYIVKMPYAFLFAIIISLTNIIPFIGPYIGGVPAILVSFSVSTRLGITSLIIIFILQFIESNFIQPYIMSKSLKINPIIIIIGLIVFGHFFGILGMLLSAPLTCIIKILINYFNVPKKVLHK